MAKVPKMKLVFVEDDAPEVERVITILDTSKYFEIVSYKDYGLVPQDRIESSDLFVLDVLTAGGDEPFTKFVRTLRLHEQPFIAFTRMHEHGQLRSVAGEPRLRRTVFEYGGLGMVSKFPAAGEEGRVSKSDLEMDLIEQIMSFFWAWRTARTVEA